MLMKRFARVPRRACCACLVLALMGMAGCSLAAPIGVVEDERALDRLWVALGRGDLHAARQVATTVQDPWLAARARLDLLQAERGRASALLAALEREGALAARYDKSGAVARARLLNARRAGADEAWLWIEEARRSESVDRALSAARAAQGRPGGVLEGLALEVEWLLASGRLAQADARLDELPVDSARLRLARRRLDGATGRWQALVDGVIGDLHDGVAVATDLVLLEDVVLRGAAADSEAAIAQALHETRIVGERIVRARERLAAILEARQGQAAAAARRLAALAPLLPEERDAVRRWELRARSGEATSLDERIEADALRVEGVALRQRRLAAEWDLAARESYDERGAGGESLDALLRRLDAAAEPLGGAPRLSELPRRDVGPFGRLLDVAALRTELPDAFLLAGQALTRPAEFTWYDRLASETVPLDDGLGTYERVQVARPRVPGLAASRGASISGAGIDRSVYLDLDELLLEARASELGRPVPALAPLPAVGRLERCALDEPLDVAARLRELARAASATSWTDALLETLALHEHQHIVDFQTFVQRGGWGRLGALAGAGLLPFAVQTEIERRAQLHALRHARDPRLPLAQLVERVPVEGAAAADEHAVAYARLLSEFIARLDAGAAPGLSREHVLLQQLDRLDPEFVRAIARALPD